MQNHVSGRPLSPLLEPENTGALVAFVFTRKAVDDTPDCNVWVCRSSTEEYVLESIFGLVEPGKTIIQSPPGSGVDDVIYSDEALIPPPPPRNAASGMDEGLSLRERDC